MVGLPESDPLLPIAQAISHVAYHSRLYVVTWDDEGKTFYEATAFGQAHHFDRIRTVTDFQQQVSWMDYDDYRGYINRICAGEQNILTREPVRLMEPTSGSTTATKLIPYTDTLKKGRLFQVYANYIT